jgi:hypothetical protein
MAGKQHKAKGFKQSTIHATKPNQLIHSNIYRPLPYPFLAKYWYSLRSHTIIIGLGCISRRLEVRLLLYSKYSNQWLKI